MPITPSSASVWRRYEIDGFPASGPHRPVKTEIIAWGNALEGAVAPVSTALQPGGPLGTPSSGNLANCTGFPAPTLSSISAVLGADVALNNTGLYFTGPQIAQGTVGTWFVSGGVTLTSTASSSSFFCKLWDGTTVIASGAVTSTTANTRAFVALCGLITNPVGNLRISVSDVVTTAGGIRFNNSGNSKDSFISAFRIA